jgi:hypothetical protein
MLEFVDAGAVTGAEHECNSMARAERERERERERVCAANTSHVSMPLST